MKYQAHQNLIWSKTKHKNLYQAISALNTMNFWISKWEEDEMHRLLNSKTLKKYSLHKDADFDKLGSLVWDWIQAYMIDVFGMQKVFVPFDEHATENKARAPIFVSSDWYSNSKRALVLIQGTGQVRAGCWSRSVCVKDTIELGSMIPDIEFAQKNGFSVIVMNPNYDEDENGICVDDLIEPMTKHTNYVWDNFVENGKWPAKEIFIIAHSAGGSWTQDIILEHQETMIQWCANKKTPVKKMSLAKLKNILINILRIIC